MAGRLLRVLVAAVASVVAGTAAAQTAAPHGQEPVDPTPALTADRAVQPWSRGVTDAQRQVAGNLVEAGNKLFLQSRPRAALAKYEKALGVWNHPAIYFNVARTLILLDRPVDAYAKLESALAYGEAPLQPQIYLEAKNYHRLLRSQIASLALQCEQSGVRVTVDGKELLVGPGSRTVHLAPGYHQVVGVKPGFVPFTTTALALPTEPASLRIRLHALGDAGQMRRRWAVQLPWAVLGSGLAAAAIGGLLQYQARADLDQYADEVSRTCQDTPCPSDRLPDRVLSRARFKNGMSVAMFVVGGSSLITGAAMAILNRPIPVTPDAPGPSPAQGEPAHLRIQWQVSTDTIGASAVYRF